MAISRFDNPAEMQLLDTYVPLPYEMIQNKLNRKQAEIDAMEKGAADTKDAILKLQVKKTMPLFGGQGVAYDELTNPDWVELNKRQTDIKNKVNELAGNYNPDDPRARELYNEIKNEGASLASDVLQMKESEKAMDEDLKEYLQSGGGGTAQNRFLPHNTAKINYYKTGGFRGGSFGRIQGKTEYENNPDLAFKAANALDKNETDSYRERFTTGKVGDQLLALKEGRGGGTSDLEHQRVFMTAEPFAVAHREKAKTEAGDHMSNLLATGDIGRVYGDATGAIKEIQNRINGNINNLKELEKANPRYKDKGIVNYYSEKYDIPKINSRLKEQEQNILNLERIADAKDGENVEISRYVTDEKGNQKLQKSTIVKNTNNVNAIINQVQNDYTENKGLLAYSQVHEGVAGVSTYSTKDKYTIDPLAEFIQKGAGHIKEVPAGATYSGKVTQKPGITGEYLQNQSNTPSSDLQSTLESAADIKSGGYGTHLWSSISDAISGKLDSPGEQYSGNLLQRANTFLNNAINTGGNIGRMVSGVVSSPYDAAFKELTDNKLTLNNQKELESTGMFTPNAIAKIKSGKANDLKGQEAEDVEIAMRYANSGFGFDDIRAANRLAKNTPKPEGISNFEHKNNIFKNVLTNQVQSKFSGLPYDDKELQGKLNSYTETKLKNKGYTGYKLNNETGVLEPSDINDFKRKSDEGKFGDATIVTNLGYIKDENNIPGVGLSVSDGDDMYVLTDPNTKSVSNVLNKINTLKDNESVDLAQLLNSGGIVGQALLSKIKELNPNITDFKMKKQKMPSEDKSYIFFNKGGDIDSNEIMDYLQTALTGYYNNTFKKKIETLKEQ